MSRGLCCRNVPNTTHNGYGHTSRKFGTSRRGSSNRSHRMPSGSISRGLSILRQSFLRSKRLPVRKTEKLRRGGQGIARRKVMGSAVSLTTMTDSLHSHNSNHVCDPGERRGGAQTFDIPSSKISAPSLCEQCRLSVLLLAFDLTTRILPSPTSHVFPSGVRT